MAVFSSIRSRRFASSQTEKDHPLISFRLREHWFALPISAVQRVIILGQVYGDPNGTGFSLTRYQNQELLVLDVGYKIFGEQPKYGENIEKLNDGQQRYLVILEYGPGELLGLPIDSPPSIRRAPESSFNVIPDSYLRTGNIRCISSKMVQIPDSPPIFLLDPVLLSKISNAVPT